jgi:hypothetical protein
LVVEVLMSAYEACPKCGADCWRESADVGVGIIYGPWGCPECCWSESPEYDLSEGQSAVRPAGVIDQWGGLTPSGKPGAVADEVDALFEEWSRVGGGA